MGTEAYLLAAIGALAAVVTVLWRNDVANYTRDRVEWKAAMADMVERIRVLEQSRLDAANRRGDEMKAMAEKFVKELADNSSVLRGLKDAFDGFTKALATRPCMHDLEPTTLQPRPSTENVTRKDAPCSAKP